jgi:hypothetical protein
MSETSIPEKRKRHRGAQPGNQNARKNVYMDSFTPSELAAFSQDINGEFIDELALTRVQIGRLANIVKNYENMSLDNYIAASNALCHFLDRYQRLTRAQHFIFRNQTTMEQALEELSKIPPEVD